MGDTLYHTLVNPNQLPYDGNQVQYNLMSEIPLSIITEYGEFSTELSMEGNIVFDYTHTFWYAAKIMSAYKYQLTTYLGSNEVNSPKFSQ